MGKRPEIPQTKRSQYRPMNQMNGDYLAQLKKPICSEMTPDFRGGMRARDAACRQQVSCWYKDREFNIRKLNRSEDAVYQTLVVVHRERRKLQRLAHQRSQEESRKRSLDSQNGFQNRLQILPDIGTLHTDDIPAKQEPDKTEPTEKAIENEFRNKPNEDSTENKPVGRSKVLRVQKGKHEPETEEVREKVDSKCEKSSGTESELNSPITSTIVGTPSLPQTPGDNAVDQVKRVDANVDDKSSKSTCQKGYRPKVKTVMPSIAESESSESGSRPRSKSRSPVKSPVKPRFTATSKSDSFGLVTHMQSTSADSFFREKAPLKSRESCRSLNSIEEEKLDIMQPQQQISRKESLVALNRKRRKLQDKYRKDVLNKERIILYDRNTKGELIPALRTFKRKEFPVPSNREAHFRKKLLTQLQVLKDLEADRIDRFFEKIEAEQGEEMRAFRLRVPQPPPEEEPPRRLALNPGLVSLQRLAEVYTRPQTIVLPDGVNPDSIEAIKLQCAYLRNYELDDSKSEIE